VRIFGAQEEHIKSIQDLVFQVEENLFPESEFCLMPMVKTLVITKEYYPDMYGELVATRLAKAMRSAAVPWGNRGTPLLGPSSVGSLSAVAPVSTDSRFENVFPRRADCGNQTWNQPDAQEKAVSQEPHDYARAA